MFQINFVVQIESREGCSYEFHPMRSERNDSLYLVSQLSKGYTFFSRQIKKSHLNSSILIKKIIPIIYSITWKEEKDCPITKLSQHFQCSHTLMKPNSQLTNSVELFSCT